MRRRRNNLAIYRNGDGGLDAAVRGQDHRVRISPGGGFFVFNGQDITITIGLAEFLDIKNDIVSASGFYPENFEWIGFFAGNGDRLLMSVPAWPTRRA